MSSHLAGSLKLKAVDLKTQMQSEAFAKALISLATARQSEEK